MVKFVWHSELVPDDMLITQVSGILVSENNKVLLYEESDGKYRIPGGHPNVGEDLSTTLIRESLEEVNTEISDIVYLGFQEVIGDGERQPYAQVRMIAKINKIGELKPDDDNGITYNRLLVNVDEVNNYLKWGIVGDNMMERVKNFIK